MGAVVDPILPLLQAPDAVAILDTAYQLSAIQNSQNIHLAVERCSNCLCSQSYIHQIFLVSRSLLPFPQESTRANALSKSNQAQH